MLDNTPNQQTKYRTTNWVEINEEKRGTYNTNSHIEFETSISNQIYVIKVMCTYLLLELLKSQIQRQQQTQTIKKNIIIKKCAPFTDCISEINNTGIDNAKKQ